MPSALSANRRGLPVLAPSLPLPTPVPQRTGQLGCGYPWRWSVVPWLAGAPADQVPPDSTQGGPLADFLLALHQPVPENAPVNEVRGVPFSACAEVVEGRLTRLQQTTPHITDPIDTIWQEALNAPVATEVLWVHGDLHALMYWLKMA
ncbi:MAG: phosphotransferase [Proteobacteria bacterium]|nr:phosphotransferase [Pseudomonadota bacterium]